MADPMVKRMKVAANLFYNCNVIEKFNSKTIKLEAVTGIIGSQLPGLQRQYQCFSTQGGNLFVICGSQQNKVNAYVFAYHHASHEFEQVQDMLHARILHSIHHQQGQNFAIIVGGQDDSTQIKSCEFYNFKNQKSCHFGKLNKGRKHCGTLMGKGYFLVFGGFANTVERHDMEIGSDFKNIYLKN